MRALAVLIAVLSSAAVLLGYFLAPLLPVLASIQTQLLSAAMTLAGVAVLAGIFNLFSVHVNKTRRDRKNGIYSALLVVSLLGTFLLVSLLRPGHALVRIIVLESVVFPIESALMGILTVSLLYAAIRLLRRRLDAASAFFLLTTVIVLLGAVTLPALGGIPFIGEFSRWWTQVLALGGMRGILIGVALGAFFTGLRVLFGADRPYGG